MANDYRELAPEHRQSYEPNGQKPNPKLCAAEVYGGSQCRNFRPKDGASAFCHWHREAEITRKSIGAQLFQARATIAELREKLKAAEAKAASSAKVEREAWYECIASYGPLLLQAKEDGILDQILRANIFPVPATCISEADISASINEARRIRPMIEQDLLDKQNS